MRKAKEKRIKKIRKKSVVPHILGLILIVLIGWIFVSMAFGTSIEDIMSRKFMYMGRNSDRVAELFADYNPQTEEKIETEAMSYIDIMEEIEAVSVIDKDGNHLWSSSNEYPAADSAVKALLWAGFINEESDFIISSDKEELFLVENDMAGVNVLRFFDIFCELIATEDVNASSEPIKVWLIVPVNDMEVFVLNSFSIQVQDFLMPIICFAICIITIAIFVLYYLFSIISMAVNAHKTTKIIYTDMVTGGDNWLMFIKKGTKLLKKNGIGRRNYAVLHLKMRKYRSFCTCFGVNRGEELIERFYNVLKKEIQRKEAMAHHENASFGLLLTYTDTAQLEERIQKIEKMLSMVLPGMKVYFGVGIYQVQPREKDIEQLHNNAMIACESFGEETENKIAYFDVEMNNRKLWVRKVEDDMERALANREFQVYLQPKISTNDEVLGGAEALVRWIHPTEGFIPPNRFIPIFENNGFILKLDDYMLEEIARVQAGWLAEGRTLVPISVNVSRAHFTREDLAEHICAIVDKYQIPHGVIELELTESAFFDDKNVLLNTVRKLRESGFKVSMDDFGAGYSSLNSLKELQIDVLKIDADFFRGADVEERGLLIVSEVIDLAKKLDMKIVAEGIESREQVEFLTEQECDLIQGYFYAKPMPVTEFAEKYNV